MKNFLAILTTIVILSAMFALPMVSALVNVAHPLNETNHTGTMHVNCSYVNGTDITAALSANSNWTYNLSGVDTVMPHTGFNCTETFCNATIDISALTDGIDYTIKCALGNATASNFSLGNSTKVTLDSTNPICTIGVSHEHLAFKGIQEVEWNPVDTSLVSVAVSIDRPGSGSTLSYTDTSRVLQLTSQDTSFLGDWSATLGVRDRAFNECNETITWKSYLPGDLPEESKTDTKTLLLIIGGIILVFYFLNKK